MKKKIKQMGIMALIALMILMAACNNGTEEQPSGKQSATGETVEALAGKLLILQAYGTGAATDGSVSHSFVELYNTTNTAVNLTGYSLQYAEGTKVADGADRDGDWTVINLNGSIPAGGSYLILGQKNNLSGRLQITDESGDINEPEFVLSNRAFKVALLHRTEVINEQNPFNIDGNGKKNASYIDMVGAANDASSDQILGCETAPARISKQVAVRRKSLIDTNDNLADFESADYRTGGSGMSAELMEVRKPRNAAAGNWNPFALPEEPTPLPIGTDYTKLILNEICGDQKFVEIYNSGAAAIPLQGVKLDRNDGGSSWIGGASDSIPAGAYRLFLFNSYAAGLNNNPAYTGWNVNSGISDQQTLKITLFDPEGTIIDVFMRGTSPWGSTSGVDRERDYSYSRMTGNIWAYASPTPGIVNGAKVKDIVNPGYYSTTP